MRVPKETDTQVVVVVDGRMIVVDVEAISVEVADVDTVVVRIQIVCQLSSIFTGS